MPDLGKLQFAPYISSFLFGKSLNKYWVPTKSMWGQALLSSIKNVIDNGLTSMRYICKKPGFIFDQNNFYTNQKCFIISLSDKYLLGILNSSLNFFLFCNILPKLRGDFYEPSYVFFKDFPIRTIDFNNSSEKKLHDALVSLVDVMLNLNKKILTAKGNEKEQIQRQIEKTDREIDEIVYELYGITEEEKKIIESKG